MKYFECAHLKFTVYGHKQVSKQASNHTHACVQWSTVWGLLRLAPISLPGVHQLVATPES